MVRVHVGDDDTQHRQAFERMLKNLLPLLAGMRLRHTGIDNGPALATFPFIAYKPEIDVVQHKRQSDAQPFHAWCYIDGLALRGQLLGKRIRERALKLRSIHANHCGRAQPDRLYAR